MPEKKVPLCRKCEENHYNIWTCERAEDMRKKAESLAARRREKKVVPAYRNDSAREWKGDKLQSFNRAGNMYWRRKGV